MGANVRRRLVAVCQLSSSHDKEENYKICEGLIRRASQLNAQMAFLPECFDYVGRSKDESVQMAHSEDGEYIGRFRSLAKHMNIWLSLGGFHETNPSEESRIFNTHLILDNQGKTVAKYHKLHLFDVEIPGKVRAKESDFSVSGQKLIPPIQTPFGRIGLATCYDLRFPEFSCWLREKGCDLITYPSAFTLNTGLAHWEEINGPTTEYAFGECRISSTIVFYRTPLSYAFVNRKPVLPGHVLIAPVRPVKKMTDLGPAEVSDLFCCTQKVMKCLAIHYGVTSTTVTVQDGPDAGQSVEHVHVHVLPRKPGDFKENDDIYTQLEKHDKNVDERTIRSREDMEKEASAYRQILVSL